MEVLSARMAPAFKGNESWRYNRTYDRKHSKQSNVKVEHMSDRIVTFEVASLGESGHKKPYSGGANSSNGGSKHSGIHRSPGRISSEGASIPNGRVPSAENPQGESETSQGGHPDDPDSSEDRQPDDSDNSDDEEPMETPATQVLQKWPIIHIVEPPAWLPEGWTAVLRTRESGSKDKYYVDPVSQRRFRSKTEVNYFLQTGKSYRYKRNLALLTKPLKEDPVSLPKTLSMRSMPLDLPTTQEAAIPFLNPTSVYGFDCDDRRAVIGRASQAANKRLSVMAPHAELLNDASSKAGPKPKFQIFSKESSRHVPQTSINRMMLDERKAPVISQGLGTDNRGKLILKLKRKTMELADGQRNGKRPRPFEVVGLTPLPQGYSKSLITEEASRNQKPHTAVLDHTVECPATMPHLPVPSTHGSRRPINKAPPWQYHLRNSSSGCRFFGGSRNLSNTSNGYGLADKISGSFSIAEFGNAKVPSKRESPAEQLQRVGRKLCQQAVGVLSSEHGKNNTLQQISNGLHAAMGHLGHGLSVRFSVPFKNVFSPALNPGLTLNHGCHSAAPQRNRPIKRLLGRLPKVKGVIPMHIDAGDHIYRLVPQNL